MEQRYSGVRPLNVRLLGSLADEVVSQPYREHVAGNILFALYTDARGTRAEAMARGNVVAAPQTLTQDIQESTRDPIAETEERALATFTDPAAARDAQIAMLRAAIRYWERSQSTFRGAYDKAIIPGILDELNMKLAGLIEGNEEADVSENPEPWNRSGNDDAENPGAYPDSFDTSDNREF